MRLFLAIELPQPLREHLASIAARWKQTAECSWVRTENLHVTLKFFGDMGESDVPRLCEALSSTPRVGLIRLLPDQVECLPPRGPVRVIAIGFADPLPQLEELYRQIEERCEPLGFARERRRYRPHITLGRARRPLSSSQRRTLTEQAAKLLPAPQMTADRFVLMESRLHPKGAQYLPLARFPLAASG